MLSKRSSKRKWSLSCILAQVQALKALSIKLINTATFVYQLYRIQSGASNDTVTSIDDTGTFQVAYCPATQPPLAFCCHNISDLSYMIPSTHCL